MRLVASLVVALSLPLVVWPAHAALPPAGFAHPVNGAYLLGPWARTASLSEIQAVLPSLQAWTVSSCMGALDPLTQDLIARRPLAGERLVLFALQARPELDLHIEQGLRVESHRSGHARPDGVLAPIATQVPGSVASISKMFMTRSA